MLEYEWGNAAPNIFTGEDETNNNPITTTTTTHHHHPDHLDSSNRYIFDPFSSTANNHINFNDPINPNTTTCTSLLIPSSSSASSSPYYNNAGPPNFYNQNTQFHSFPADPRLNFYHPTPNINIPPSMLSLETLTHSQLEPNNYSIPPMMLPKQEPYMAHDYNSTPSSTTSNNNNNRIGLNLGGRTYFSASDDHDLVNRLYRRGTGGGNGRAGGYDHGGGVGANSGGAKCQAEGCNADLSNSKHYHRRHKVCEFHSKASTVIAAGLTQRFCQQCSRFHLLTEFDNGKRSCRRRLADHNRRRRKSNQIISTSNQDSRSDHHSSRSKSETPQRSPSDSGIHSSSSVTVAVSPPRMSLDSFKQSSTRPSSSSSYNVLMMGGTGTTTSAATNCSASSASLFYSS